MFDSMSKPPGQAMQ